MDKLITVLFGISFLGLLFVILPFKIELPTELYNFLVSGSIKNVMNSIRFFIPVNFILMCIIAIYTVRYGKVLFNLITWIYHKIFA